MWPEWPLANTDAYLVRMARVQAAFIDDSAILCGWLDMKSQANFGNSSSAGTLLSPPVRPPWESGSDTKTRTMRSGRF